MAANPATSESVDLLLADQPAIRFQSPPPSVVEWVEHRYGALLVGAGSAGEAPVTVRFEPLTPPVGSIRLGVDAMQTAATPDRRFLLVDEAGRGGQLPCSGAETELVCDPDLDAQLWGPFHTWLERIIDWQAGRREMVTFKGGAVTLSGRTVVIAAFQGSGKSSTILALLDDADAYLAEDRLTMFKSPAGSAVAAFPVPIRLSRGRDYQLPDDLLRRSLSTFDRRLLVAARRMPARARRWLRDRWVPLDLRQAFPDLAFPTSATADAIVFLQPRTGGSISCERIPRERSVALARELVAFHHDRYIAPFEQMHNSAYPEAPPWPVIRREAKMDLVEPILAKLPAFLVQVPIGTASAETAVAVRRALEASAGSG